MLGGGFRFGSGGGGGGLTRVYDVVKDYGAIGDGVANDTTAIQDAINQAATDGGGMVFLPEGVYLVSGINMKTGVTLYGTGFLSELKAANLITRPVIQNDGGATSTVDRITLRDFSINGNKTGAPSTSVHGIWIANSGAEAQGPYTVAGTKGSGQLNLVEHVLVHDCAGKGILHDTNALETEYRGVWVWGCTGIGYDINGADAHIVQCVAATNGSHNFDLKGGSIRVTGCKSYFPGQSVTGHAYVVGSAVEMVGCEAQDFAFSGYYVWSVGVARDSTIIGCTAKADSAAGGGSNYGVTMDGATHCVVDVEIAPTAPTHGIQFIGGAADNVVRIMQRSVATSYVQGTVGENDLSINNERDGLDAAAFVASYTPNPYEGGIKAMTLTANITVNNPSQGHVGSTLQFIFTQDATGGRTVTWGANYKTNWTPDTAANKINSITFRYNGTNWVQVAAATGL